MTPERCPACGRLLYMAEVLDGTIEIKCRCGEMVTKTYRPRPARVRTNEYGIGVEALDAHEPQDGRPTTHGDNRRRHGRTE